MYVRDHGKLPVSIRGEREKAATRDSDRTIRREIVDVGYENSHSILKEGLPRVSSTELLATENETPFGDHSFMYVNCTTQAVFIVVSCEAHNQSASWEVCTATTSNGRETSIGWKPNGLIPYHHSRRQCGTFHCSCSNLQVSEFRTPSGGSASSLAPSRTCT